MLLCALALAPASARADVAYSGSGVIVPSRTGKAPQDLPATLLRPEGPGPFPAIVVLHDCSGLGPRSSGAPLRWGSLLAAHGYVVLIPDSFLPRGLSDGVCTVPLSAQPAGVSVYARPVDAYAALAYLRTLPFVAAGRIGVMGGSHGGSSTLATLARTSPEIEARRSGAFAAGVALYPGCGARFGAWSVTRAGGTRGPVTAFEGTYEPVAPLLILIGADDDWTPAEHCRVLAERSAAAGFPVSIKIYPGARHSFDSANPPRYAANRNNANKPDGLGATTGGDPAAWADAVQQVLRFFAARLGAE
jgi:dienelactone hydrolase